MATKAPSAGETVVITAPRFRTLTVKLTGTSPYMQARFSMKAKGAMMDKMAAGTQATGKKVRAPRNFEDDMLNAQHISTEGWNGIPAAAFRNACIDVCRMVSFKMTHAKMSIFVEAGGIDRVDGSPMVRLDAKPPERTELPVRNATGVMDIRIRPIWREWKTTIKIRFDEDQFSVTDVVNLISRAGMQVGIGEGRPYSRESNGMGYGLFSVEEVKG